MIVKRNFDTSHIKGLKQEEVQTMQKLFNQEEKEIDPDPDEKDDIDADPEPDTDDGVEEPGDGDQ